MTCTCKRTVDGHPGKGPHHAPGCPLHAVEYEVLPAELAVIRDQSSETQEGDSGQGEDDWINETHQVEFTGGELWELRALALEAGVEHISPASRSRKALAKLDAVLPAPGGEDR